MFKSKKSQSVKPKTGKPKAGQWSGRFAQKLDPLANRFNQSISFDYRLYRQDIQGSLAHAAMLKKIGLLTDPEWKSIDTGLKGILKDIEAGRFEFKEELEDIHRNIESELMKRIGAPGGKLHTARSRNDQVALDVRLYCRDRLQELHEALVDLEKAFVQKAKQFLKVALPGYTHLQRAQPILFSHHLMAYVEMFERDRARLQDAYKRVNVLPLGSGALAGTTFPIDREYVAKLLGFDSVSRNSLDAVSDRDFAIEISSACSILMMHLSRLSEEMILWSTSEFQFIHLPESFCTGSSMMPQKMNPDILELTRGKTGRVYGHLTALLTTMKSLPLAYNKDMQEDKEPLFDLFDTVLSCVRVLTPLMAGVRPNQKKMQEAVSDGFLLATELADWLVRDGLNFRAAHEVSAKTVRYALDQGKDLTALTLAEMQQFSSRIKPELLEALTVSAAIDARRATGGTSAANVKNEINRLEKTLKQRGIKR